MKPQPAPKVILPMLTEITPLGDGRFILRPVPVETDFDTWIKTDAVCAILGISRSTCYDLLDPYEPYLVFRRPAQHLHLVSFRSTIEYRAASAAPEFWSKDGKQRQAYSKTIADKISKLSTLTPQTLQPS